MYCTVYTISREYELFQEAHAYLSVVRNCSSFCHPLCRLQPAPPAAAETPSPQAVSLTPEPEVLVITWGR